jgi:hypothetical protein
VEGHLVAVGVGERESAAERPVDGHRRTDPTARTGDVTPPHRPPDQNGSDESSADAAGQNFKSRRCRVPGTVLEDVGFLVRPLGALFVVLHRPADRPSFGSFTVCSSLFAELHTD